MSVSVYRDLISPPNASVQLKFWKLGLMRAAVNEFLRQLPLLSQLWSSIRKLEVLRAAVNGFLRQLALLSQLWSSVWKLGFLRAAVNDFLRQVALLSQLWSSVHQLAFKTISTQWYSSVLGAKSGSLCLRGSLGLYRGCNMDSQCCNGYEFCVSCCLNPTHVSVVLSAPSNLPSHRFGSEFTLLRR